MVRGSVGVGAALQGYKVRCMYWDAAEFFVLHSQDIDGECEQRYGGYRGGIEISRNARGILDVSVCFLFYVIKSVVMC